MRDLKGIDVSDILGIAQPMTKLIETVGSAIGTWYAPTGVRRMAKAKAFELQTVSEAINSNIQLPVEYSDGRITVSSQDFEELAKRTGNRLYYQELRKQQNIEAIVELSGMELGKERTVSDEPVDPDWTIRFFNSVEDVSNEDMQKLWGRVLSGEVKKPGSFSMRTLENLRNMSQQDAFLFEKISDFCFYGGKYVMIPCDEKLNDKHGLSYSDLLKLDECGLIGSSQLTYNITLPAFHNAHLKNQNVIGLICNKNDSEIKISLDVFYLTNAGVEVFDIINKNPNMAYFIDYLSVLKIKHTNLFVTAHTINSIAENSINYSDDDLLSPDENSIEVR